MNEDKKQQIFDKITQYDSIIICRHLRPDGDAVGSSMGLKHIITDSFPQKSVYVINDDRTDYINFLGDEDSDVDDETYKKSLCIVLDTATKDRIANKRIDLCKELIKIDHHIETTPYGNISWVEDWRSSLCELIVDFYNFFSEKLVLSSKAAECIYTGMVTDSGRFRFDVQGDTMRRAGILLDKGVDTALLYARLYIKDFDYTVSRNEIQRKMKITKNGVAHFFITEKMREKYNLTVEEASNCVTLLEGIRGCLIWIAFIEYPDKTVRARLRSRFVPVNTLAEKYHGGGHAFASGATCKTKAEMKHLLEDADIILGEYKSTHEGWL